MRRLALILALALVAAACGDDDATPTTTAPATTAATATTEAASDEDMSDDDMSDDDMSGDDDMADEDMDDMSDEGTDDDMAMTGAVFEITQVTFGAPMVVITNVGTESGDLGGWWLCQRPSYQELPSVEVGAGESVAISLGGDAFLPPPGALTIDEQLNLGSISSTDGEIGLYSTNNFGSADAIVSYVEWGNSGHGRSSTAVAAGLWDEGGFVATTDASAGIQQDTPFSMSSTGWSDF